MIQFGYVDLDFKNLNITIHNIDQIQEKTFVNIVYYFSRKPRYIMPG